jgi:hypothetical protein
MSNGTAIGRQPQPKGQPSLVALATVVTALLSPAMLMPSAAWGQSQNSTIATTLSERQALLRQLTQQQQSVLQQRMNCINRVRNLEELERCQRGDPLLGPSGHHGRGMGGWTCPMW